MSQTERQRTGPSGFEVDMRIEFRRLSRQERPQGASAKGAVAAAKRILSDRFSPSREGMSRLEVECNKACRVVGAGYVKAHVPGCVVHRLDRARAEVERRERMCKKHGAPDRQECGQCYPRLVTTRASGNRGW